MEKFERDLRIGQRQSQEGFGDVPELGGGAFDEFSAGGGVEKKIANFDDGADVAGGGLGIGEEPPRLNIS